MDRPCGRTWLSTSLSFIAPSLFVFAGPFGGYIRCPRRQARKAIRFCSCRAGSNHAAPVVPVARVAQTFAGHPRGLSAVVEDSRRTSQEHDIVPSARSSRAFFVPRAAISLEKVVLPQR